VWLPCCCSAGYINYLDFFFCDAPNLGAQIFAFLLLLLWMAFLLHLVETTTNECVASSDSTAGCGCALRCFACVPRRAQPCR
jgi:hypothetical protein